MKLTVYFYDAKGCSVASPEIIEREIAETAYTRAIAMQRRIEVDRGFPVFLHTVEDVCRSTAL